MRQRDAAVTGGKKISKTSLQEVKSVPFLLFAFYPEISRPLFFCPFEPKCCRVLFVPAVTQPPRCRATKVKVTPSALRIPMREQPSFLVSHLFASDSEGQNKSSDLDHNGADFHAFFLLSVHICDKFCRCKQRIKMTAFGVSAADYTAFVQVCLTCLQENFRFLTRCS